MVSNRTLQVLVVAAILGLLAVLAGAGVRWIRHRQVEAEVMAALRNRDFRGQLQAFVRLRDNNRVEALRILAGLLEDSDRSVRTGAIRAISMVQAKDALDDSRVVDPVLEASLTSELRANADAAVRLGCAINLMSVRTPKSDAALNYAIHDSNDKVVQLACGEVGRRRSPGASDALHSALSHPSWRVRLEACKALITSGYADDAVVSILEQMSREPEAAVYDAEIDEFDRRERETGLTKLTGKGWDKLDAILKQARDVARRDKKSSQ
jgi:hypothetical protein